MKAKLNQFIVGHKRLLAVAFAIVILLPLTVTAVSSVLIGSYGRYVLNAHDQTAIRNMHARVGIVMGAGITTSGKPYRELQARLDVAAVALKAGYVDELILTGDNRFTYYDEPGAMRRYLVTVQHIPSTKLQPDYAGRDTYQSCVRAAKIFGIRKAIIFSADSHLPRAIFLCRSKGIESYGLASNVEADNIFYREPVARVKALLNIYIHDEKTVMGPPIKI